MKILFFLLLMNPTYASDFKKCTNSEEATSRLGFLECVKKDHKYYDIQLNQTYRETLKGLKKASFGEKVNALKQSQRSWIKFRDSTCNLYELIDQKAYGSYLDFQIECERDLTKQRALYLMKIGEMLISNN